jgi:hypothetical protein
MPRTCLSDGTGDERIGAQIRADLYGWVVPGQPGLAAELAGRDAALSHRAEGVHGAQFVAAAGAALLGGAGIAEAVDAARSLLPADSACAAAVDLGGRLATAGDGPAEIHDTYESMSPVHTVNNLALVVWGLTGRPIPAHWTEPWAGRVRTSLAGIGELRLDDLVGRTLAVCESR